jgi:amino acid efflux transporter
MSGMSMPQGAAVSIGAVLGTGVIALPALAAQAAGPASLLAWAALVVLSVPLAVTFATLGARYPDSGGVSTYVRKAFGPRAAAACGWCFCFAVPAGAPAAAMFGGAYVAAEVGGGMRTTLITAALLIIAVTGMNLGGLQISGRIQLGLAGLLLILLVTATVTALPHAHLSNLHPFAPHGWLAIGPAAAVLVWGFAGWEAITSLAADFRNPARDLPRATAIALVVVSVLYLAVATTSVAVLGPAAGTTQAPLAALLSIGTGANARLIAAVAAILLTLGTMNAYFAAAAKTGAALGRDGALPVWLARGSAAGQVPRRSLMVLAGMSGLALIIVATTGASARQAALVTTGSFVVVYIAGTAAAVRLLPRGSWPRRAAMAALAAVIVLLLVTGVYALWAVVIVIAALLYQRRRASQLAAGTRTSLDEQQPSACPLASGAAGSIAGG